MNVSQFLATTSGSHSFLTSQLKLIGLQLLPGCLPAWLEHQSLKFYSVISLFPWMFFYDGPVGGKYLYARTQALPASMLRGEYPFLHHHTQHKKLRIRKSRGHPLYQHRNGCHYLKTQDANNLGSVYIRKESIAELEGQTGLLSGWFSSTGKPSICSMQGSYCMALAESCFYASHLVAFKDTLGMQWKKTGRIERRP